MVVNMMNLFHLMNLLNILKFNETKVNKIFMETLFYIVGFLILLACIVNIIEYIKSFKNSK